MKIDDIFSLIDGLLEDFSNINNKNHKKSFKRKVNNDKIKTHINISLDGKKISKSKEGLDVWNRKKSGEKQLNLGFFEDYRDLIKSLNFTDKEIKLILQVTKRNNNLWANDLARNILIKSYLSVLKESFDQEDIDTTKIIKYTSPYTLSKNILDSLLVISEQRLRKDFWVFADIDSSRAEEVLISNQVVDLLEFFIKRLEVFYKNLDPDLKSKLYENYLWENPKKVKDWLRYIKTCDVAKQIDFMAKIKDEAMIKELANGLSKESFKPSLVIGFYYLYKYFNPTMATQSRLFKIILEENYDSFLEIISKKDLSLETINKILDLDKKKLKRIDIDDKKLKISRKELNKTVNIVTDFIGDDLVLKEDEKALSPEEIVDKQAYRLDENAEEEGDKGLEDFTHKFLKDLLARGEIPEAEVKSIALSNSKMLNSFLKDMNDQLYDYTADQTLINEDGYIRIDPFYEEMVKEIVDGKYKS